MEPMKDLIIFTDLDGSLLDSESYTASPADTLFELLDSHGIPVIFNSSKTFPEMIKIRRGNHQPFVVEMDPRSTCHWIRNRSYEGSNQSMGIDVTYLAKSVNRFKAS